MLLVIISGLKVKSAGLCALAFREHEAQLVINISWKAMIPRKPISRFYGGKEKTTFRANFDHIWYETASNGQIYMYIYIMINNDELTIFHIKHTLGHLLDNYTTSCVSTT